MFSTKVQISAILNSEDLLLRAILSLMLLLFFIPSPSPPPVTTLLPLLSNINLTTSPAARESPRHSTRAKYFKSNAPRTILLRKVQFWEDYCAEPISYFQFILDMVYNYFRIRSIEDPPSTVSPCIEMFRRPSLRRSYHLWSTTVHLGYSTFDSDACILTSLIEEYSLSFVIGTKEIQLYEILLLHPVWFLIESPTPSLLPSPWLSHFT